MPQLQTIQIGQRILHAALGNLFDWSAKSFASPREEGVDDAVEAGMGAPSSVAVAVAVPSEHLLPLAVVLALVAGWRSKRRWWRWWRWVAGPRGRP